MKVMESFLPAEILLILHEDLVEYNDMLKITFMDLIFKEVLDFETVTKYSKSSKVRYFNYVTIGAKYDSYAPLKHESIYLSPFQKSRSIRILLSHLIQIGTQNAKSKNKYISSVKHSERLNLCFEKRFHHYIFWGFSRSTKGKQYFDKLTIEMSESERELREMVIKDPDRLPEILNTLKVNVFLMKNIEIDLLIKMKIEILNKVIPLVNVTFYRKIVSSGGGCGGTSCSGCSGCGGGCGGCG
jgi:hypothetical protein